MEKVLFEYTNCSNFNHFTKTKIISNTPIFNEMNNEYFIYFQMNRQSKIFYLSGLLMSSIYTWCYGTDTLLKDFQVCNYVIRFRMWVMLPKSYGGKVNFTILYCHEYINRKISMEFYMDYIAVKHCPFACSYKTFT